MPQRKAWMFKSKQYRAKAAEYGDRAKGSAEPVESNKFQKLQDRFVSLANSEQVLADKYDNAVAEQGQARGAVLVGVEEHVLRCLGAADIMKRSAMQHAMKRGL